MFSGSDVKIRPNDKEMEFFDSEGAEMFRWFGLKVPEINIDIILKEGSITLGDETFEILLTPGYSPGSISLYWTKKKVLFSGDVIFHNNVGRTDFPGGSAALLKESIVTLSKLDVDYLLPVIWELFRGTTMLSRTSNL